MSSDYMTQLVERITAEMDGERLGSPSHNNKGEVSLRRGHAIVVFDRKGMAWRSEGEGELNLLSLPNRRSYTTLDEDAAQAVEVLRTGRTVECGPGVGLRTLQAPHYVHFETVDYPLQEIERVLTGDEDSRFAWDLDPDWQREHTWTRRQQEDFMGYFLIVRRMPLIFIHRPGGWDTPWTVVDGKQRLQAMLRFVRGEIGARLTDGTMLRWRDFDEGDRRACPDVKCARVQLQDREQTLVFYLGLNNGGTRHTKQEIARVQALLDEERARKAEGRPF